MRQVILEDASHGSGRLLVYSAPLRTVSADEPGAVAAALDEIEEARRAGYHAAGYFSYELGYALEPRLQPLMWPGRRLPLLAFGIFESCEALDAADAFSACGRAYAGPLVHGWSEEQYSVAFGRVHELIVAGDLYQASLSFRSRFSFVGDPLSLYRELRAAAGARHCAYVDDGERQILSLSPELFFELSPDGRIAARPMKGTAPRGSTPAVDAAERARLLASEKDRAENLMIVDLMRNDLSRIADVGSVAVNDLFTVETYPTLHQLVSTITARLDPQTSAEAIVRALFPCGSVTGTPKIRSMEVIRALEADPRGVYCGAIGCFSPDGSARFNVAIRTLTICGTRGELGIGGAVVADSQAGAEYGECRLKARFLEADRRPLTLIETMRHSPREGFVRGELHLDRMARSAAAFGIAFDPQRARRAMSEAVGNATGTLHVRLTLACDGTLACEAAPFDAPPMSHLTYAISDARVASGDALLRHKTSWRELFDAERARANARDCGEAVFLNEHGEVTEGSFTNVFAQIDGGLVTPPLACGLLDGCLRHALIEDGSCSEAVLTPRDLVRAESVFLGNSLRGLIPAKAAV